VDAFIEEQSAVVLATQVAEAAAFIGARWDRVPRAGIILGTGLGEFANEIDVETVLTYEELPHFPRATAIGHKGQLACGVCCGVPVVTMEGRFHVYEGYSPQQITLPVRVMQRLGIELLIVSNASGGLNPRLAVGDIVVIEDHVNLMFANPLIGLNDATLGPRFPDMSRPYDPVLIERALRIARRANFAAHRGTYVAVSGPNYETRAEYRVFRRLGDVIGMSTAPEVIVAAQIGLPVLALSTVTNLCNPDVLAPTDGASVMAAAAQAETKLRAIVRGVLATLRAP
jgi:purine-nucleoside phosphorylase